MDHDKPSGPSMFSGAQSFSARGGQYNAIGRDMSQGVVVHVNYSEGHDTTPPRVAVPPIVLQNSADAPTEPRTNVDSGHTRRRFRISDILRILRQPQEETSIVDLAQHEETSLGSRVNASAVMAPRRSELYSRLMLHHGYGYPLYEPNPGPGYRRGVRVGDIGWVTPDGVFDFLFNVIHGSSPLPDIELEAQQQFRDGEHVLSKYVNQKEGPPITYQCSHSEGAILRLPEGATLFEVKAKRYLENLAARRAYDWYKYMMVDRARVVPNGSLYLITGCTKTKSWSIATFDGSPDDSNCLRFNADGQPGSPRNGWMVKISPNTDDATTEGRNQCVFIRGYKITLSQKNWKKLEKIAASLSHSELSGLPPTWITSINQEGSRNQNNQSTPQTSAPSHTTHNLSQLAFGEAETTGLGDLSQQGFRNLSLPNTSDNDVEEDAVEGDTTDTADEGTVDEDTVEELAGVAPPMHPSDSINPILLQLASGADVALTHDDDWCGFLPKNFADDPSRHLKDWLERISETHEAILDEYGCISLVSIAQETMTRSVETTNLEESKLASEAVLEAVQDVVGIVETKTRPKPLVGSEEWKAAKGQSSENRQLMISASGDMDKLATPTPEPAQRPVAQYNVSEKHGDIISESSLIPELQPSSADAGKPELPCSRPKSKLSVLVQGNPLLRQPSPPPITNTPAEASRLITSPSDQSKSTSTKANVTKKVTKYMKAILKSLGELPGAPAVGSFIGSLDFDERVDMRRKDLELQRGRFIKSIQSIESLMEKEGSILPESLRVSLGGLISELTSTGIINKNGTTDIESLSHEILRLLESFLSENHVAGLIKMPNILGKDEVNTRVSIQAITNIPHARGAAFNDYASKDTRRVLCLEKTREALLMGIEEWIWALDETRIYALSGLAGIGKSTIAQTVAAKADESGYLGASFFFSRDDAARRNAKRFFTTIAFQLCNYDEEFSRAIGNALLTERGAAAISKEPLEQLNALIVEPLRDLVQGRIRPLVIVIDALDECDIEDVLIVLSALDHLVRELPAFKVILTTRPQNHFDLFVGAAPRKVFYLQNIEDKIVDHDIRLYLQYHLSCEHVKGQLKLETQWSANEEEIEILVRAAGRLFIIASAAVLFILDKAVRNPGSQMKKLQFALSQDRTPFNALNELYAVILRSAVPTDRDHDIVERYQAVIGTITVVQDPLPIGALANLIGLSSNDVRAVLDGLQSVIVLGDNDIPRVYHKPLLDYITDTTRCKDDDLRIIPREQHTRIAVCCFDVMNMHLKGNILGLGTPAQYMENSDGLKAGGISDGQLREKIALELRYACIYWANHFEGADIEDINLIKKLDGFVKERLLYWLEALSWICKLDLAPRALLTAHYLLKPTSSDTREILFDGFRFISKNYEVIQRSALHVYHSALPFTPAKILLSNIYKKEGNLCQLGDGPERWGALVAIQPHRAERRFHRVAFSLDSFYLASWGGHEIKLWDATSGGPLKTFNGDKIALAGDFSIVALSKDNTLTLHNITSNAPVANYNIPSAEVVELALSFDGSRLAVGLSDGTVSLWDSNGTGGSIASLDGYACKSYPRFARYNGRLAFAPSGYHLAFLSDDGGIRLWNGFNGESIARLSYKSRKHIEIVFSHTGLRLAALTEENDLTLWNSKNGNFIGIAMDAGDVLAISDDGSLIATGFSRGGRKKGISDDSSRKKRVQLRSGNSLSVIDTDWMWPIGESIDNHWCFGESIESLAFSHDMLAIGSGGKVTLYDLQTRAIVTSGFPTNAASVRLALSPCRLAAMTTRGEVRLWDVQSMKASASESGKYPRIVTSLALSPDCLRLASGFPDGTVELWDTGRTEQVIASLKLHSSRIAALAFSADGEQLASGSVDKTVRLWGGRDAAPSGILKHIFDGLLTSLAFSSRLLAAQTRDSLTVFDCKTLRPVHTFNSGGDHLSFSSNGSLLASTTRWEKAVTVWDVETGIQLARFEPNSIGIQKLVFSPDDSQLAALTPLGFEFFDVINKHTIADPGHEEISWIFQKGTLISKAYLGLGEHLLGHFPEHRGGVPILCIPRDVSVSKIVVESSTFALGCDDGRLMIGHVPPALAT